MSAIVIGGLKVARANISKSWGLTPAGGTLELVGNDGTSLKPRDEVLLQLGSQTFHGQIKRINTTNEGESFHADVVDNRYRLSEEIVTGYWNREIELEDNPETPGIDRFRRYQSILPPDWKRGKKTIKNFPISAEQVLEDLFNAPTVDSPWSFANHPLLQNPVYNIDAEHGSELGIVLQNVLDQLGLIMTLDNAFELRFARKGEGALPPFPITSYDKRSGSAINDAAPSHVTVTGSHNLYQDVTDLQPAWNRRWEAYWLEVNWLAAVERYHGPFPMSRAGRADLAARARTVTVREMANATGDALGDDRLFGGVSRMEIPGWIYIHEIVFRSYVIPTTYKLGELHMPSTKLHDSLLAEMSFDPGTGILDYALPFKVYPRSAATVIAQGQQLSALDAARQGGLESTVLTKARDTWSAVDGFRVDRSERTFYFNSAVIRPGTGDRGMFKFPSNDINGAPSWSKIIAVPNANMFIEPAPVKAAFVIEGEVFNFAKGGGKVRAARQQASLASHILLRGQSQQEIPYRSGETAPMIAETIADSALSQQPEISDGGYKVPGSGTRLEPTLDRVSVTLDSDGLREETTFSSERAEAVFDAEKTLSRRRQTTALFPKQEQVAEEARQLSLISSLHRGQDSTAAELYYATSVDLGRKPVTSSHVNPFLVFNKKPRGLAAGTCLFGSAGGGVEITERKEFQGVVVMDGIQTVDIPVARTGIVPVRVKGPFKPGDIVGVDEDEDYAKRGGEAAVGRVRIPEEYDGAQTVLVPVALDGTADEEPYKPPFAFTLGNTIDEDDGRPRLSFEPAWVFGPRVQDTTEGLYYQMDRVTSHPFDIEINETKMVPDDPDEPPPSFPGKPGKNWFYVEVPLKERNAQVGNFEDESGSVKGISATVNNAEVAVTVGEIVGGARTGLEDHTHEAETDAHTHQVVTPLGDMHFHIDEEKTCKLVQLSRERSAWNNNKSERLFFVGWLEIEDEAVVDSFWPRTANIDFQPAPYATSRNELDQDYNPTGEGEGSLE